MSEWTALHHIPLGGPFVTPDGKFGIKLRVSTVQPGCCVVAFCGLADNMGTDVWAGETPARHLDLPFLLAAAGDRLGEDEAYARGVRDGKAAMREHAARTARLLGRDDTQEDMALHVAEAVERLPLESGS